MRSACPWPWKISNSRLAQGGAVFGGGKGGSGGTTYQTQTTTIPPEVRARYDAVNARAEQVAQTPFQPYTGQFVAPINQTQQTAINQIGQAGQGYQPYQQAATGALTGAGAEAYPYYGMASQSLTGGLQAAVPMLGQAAGNIDQAQAAGAPYTGMATLAGLAGTQAVNPAQLDIGRYMDPYLQSVVQPTMQGLYQQQQQQQSQLMGAQAMRGAFGGDRGAIAAANLARQQGLGAAQAQSQLLSQGYQQALAAAQQQQGVGLGAAQANRQAFQQFAPQALAIGQQAFQQPMAAAQAQQGLGQAAFGMGQGMAQGQLGIGQGLLGYGQGMASGLAGLGQQGLQSQLAAGQALLGAGTLEQQTQQQLNSALYNQYLQQQGYPFQVAQFLANIALGTGPLYGSTQTGVTGQPTPFFSDERLKEDIREIGRTHDGQRIIKFRYKGEPPGTTHIGLSAQDVEKHHPEAVSETPEGIKAVDYDAATRHSEMAAGGVPVPGMNPGAEETAKGLAPWSAGLHKPENGPRGLFAAGGAPGVDAYSQELLQQIANPMGKTLPHGSFGSMPGKAGAWSPKLAAPARSSPLGSDSRLPAPPAQGKTGLGQAMDAANSAVNTFKTGQSLYEGGKKAVDWLKQQMPYDGGTATGEAAYGSPAPDPAADNPMGPRARGGRAGLAGGGSMPTDLPYSEAEGEYVPEKLTESEPTPKLDEPKMQQQSQGLGGGQQKDQTAGKAMKLAAMGASFIPGVGPFLSAGLSAGSMFVARGGAVDIEHAKKLISGIESGGRYDALGPMVRGDRAHGKYQVMGANIPSWTEAALGRRMTPEEFLKSPEAQERVFEHRFGSYLDKHGNLADAASMWHSGMPLAEARRHGARDVNMSTEDYVRKIMGGAPPAEAHIASAEPSWTKPRGGLTPTITDVEEIPTEEDNLLPKHDYFARGGLVGRAGFDDGGVPQVIDPDSAGLVPPTTPDDPAVDPAKAAILRGQQQRAGLAPADVVRATTPASQPPVTEKPIPSVVRVDPRTKDDADLAGYGSSPPPKPGLSPRAMDDRGFFDRAGDWYERNQNWVLPLVSGVGSMLASRSPFLGNAIGEGLTAGADKALSADFRQQALKQSQQRVDVQTAEAIQRQIWEAQAQRNNAIRGNEKADVAKYDDIIKRLTAKLYSLYNVPGEGLEMSAPQRGTGIFGQLHPDQDLVRLYGLLSNAPPSQRPELERQIADVRGKIVRGEPLMKPDGSALYPDENFKKALEAEASRLHVQASAPAGGMGSAERENIGTQINTLQQERNSIRQRLQDAAGGDPAIIAKIAQVQATGADPVAAGLPPQIVQMIQRIRSIYNQESNLREQLQIGVGTSPPRPGQQRAHGGRTGYQYGGGPLDMSDPAAIGKEMLDPLATPTQRELTKKAYEEATPEQTTAAGTKYRIQPFGGSVPAEDPPVPETKPGYVDERTGRAMTSAPVLPYSSTGGFPTDPNLPKKPYTLLGQDAYSNAARETSANAEKAFLEAATSPQAENNMMAILKIANAMKVVEAGGLTSRRADIANTLRGLGFDGPADTVMNSTNMNQAYIATKAALDEAIRRTSSAFGKGTQAEFQQVAAQGSPSVDNPAAANIALLKESMAQQLWQNALREDWIKARDEGRARNFTAFSERWRKAHPPEIFRQSADRLLGNVNGTDLPSPNKLTEGVVYVVPRDIERHPLRGVLGEKGLRPGDLFVISGINHDRDPDTGKPRFHYDDIQPVALDKGYDVHMRAPGMRHVRQP